jgi:hypothetical protein
MDERLIAVGYALQIAIANVAAALLLAFWAKRRADINQFFMIVVGGIAVRTVLTLLAFGAVYAMLQRTYPLATAAANGQNSIQNSGQSSGQNTVLFIFTLSFILSFAILLGMEVAILHRSQRRYSATIPSHLTLLQPEKPNDTSQQDG